jgi:uncharacterized iron-regulated membrane protein
MILRKLLFWIHLCAGCVAGTGILIMCVTGALLAFERQVMDYADRSSLTPVHVSAQRLGMQQLLADSHGGQALSAITVYSDEARPVALSFGRERTVFVDPYTGEVRGEGSKATRHFFSAVERWHRALGGQLQRGQSGSLGRNIADACNFIFLGLTVSGIYLWWPRKWSLLKLGAVTLFRRGLAGRPRHWNRHNAAGFWCVIPLFSIALTGVIMSYSWANDLLYRMAGSQPPARPAAQGEAATRTRPRDASGRGDREPIALDKLFARAEQQLPNWRSVSLRIPLPGVAAAVFTIDQGSGGQPQKRSQLTLNARNGDVLRWEPFESLSAGRRLRAWARFTHTGEAAGLAGQVVGFIACLGGVLLVWTGIRLALIRLGNSVSKRREKAAEAVEVA